MYEKRQISRYLLLDVSRVQFDSIIEIFRYDFELLSIIEWTDDT